MLLRQAVWIVHGTHKWANVIAADHNGHHFPCLLEIDSFIAFHALHQQFGHERNIGRRCTNLSHVILVVVMECECIATRITDQIRIEHFENVRQRGRIMPAPLAANAPREATVLHQHIAESNRRCTRAGCQWVAQCGNHVNIAYNATTMK